LSDLAPRVVRIGAATLDTFAAEMTALRTAFAWRADRAAKIHALLASRDAELGAARRSVAIGLSAVREEPDRIARAFLATFGGLRLRQSRFSPEQDASAAECLCLAAHDLASCERPDAAQWLAQARENVFLRFSRGSTEDALDSSLLLAGVAADHHEPRIVVASRLAADLEARGSPIPLSLALVATAGEDEASPHVGAMIAATVATLASEVQDPYERLAVAVLLTFVRGDLGGQVERWRLLRHYLARFAPDGMALAAALLSWVALEPAETLDDLRLAAAELQKRRLAEGGAETMSLAIKLLVSIAMLAAGREGDHEERLALAPIVVPRAPQLGLHGALPALPLVTTALTTFHRPVLDAALEYEHVYQSTHSAYVFGGRGHGRSYGWG
jgi:hypothetical protein